MLLSTQSMHYPSCTSGLRTVSLVLSTQRVSRFPRRGHEVAEARCGSRRLRSDLVSVTAGDRVGVSGWILIGVTVDHGSSLVYLRIGRIDL